MYERHVEVAVGFVGGQWREITVTVPESEDRVLDDELTKAATAIIKQMGFSDTVAFYHVIFIEEPEGGFGED